MAASFVSDQMALAIALSVDLPGDATRADLPPWGQYVIFNNARYQLRVSGGKYMAVDISVYADDGTLLTDAGDVYLNAIKSGALEAAQTILQGLQQAGGAVLQGGGGLLDLAANAKWVLLGALALFIYFNVKANR